MILGTVVGDITSTINHPSCDGRKLLIVDKITPDRRPTGDYLIAIDIADAGAGETVLMIDEGNSARQILRAANAPIRSVIVGIVDDIRVAPEGERP